jgi:flagellum-specific peptidoglycan hydrolase FlgJ
LIYFISQQVDQHYINFTGADALIYIQAADEASQGKVQVNWQYLAAIDGVRYHNDFHKANRENILALGNLFISENPDTTAKSKYILLSLEEVMDKLCLNKREKATVYSYLKNLQKMGNDTSHFHFIDQIRDGAIDNFQKYGILPSITIAQAILESGWGKSTLSIKANNLFGIKADPAWQGKSIKLNTTEYCNQQTTANFRVYQNINHSIKDHGKFLYNNRRYQPVFSASHYIEQAQALENAGYSTKLDKRGNPIYADLLIELIQQYNLQLLDSEVQEYNTLAN